MRVTVLCLLAFAGATCALQIPSILPPQSALDAGSSILDKVPGINQKADDSSSSGSGASSEEDQDTPQIATELAERLVDDVLNVGGGLGSAALLPLKVGVSLFNTLTKEISNFLGEVINPENLQPGDPTVPELAMDLTRSVVRDIERMARNIGTLLLEPAKLKAQLIETIASDVGQWLKKNQNQLSGEQLSQHRPRPTQRPNSGEHHSTHRPRPTSTHRPRPTSTHRPRPTPPHRPTPPSTHRPRPTSTHRPRPTPSDRPSSQRPRPTPSDRPSSERPRPTSSERPRPTLPGQPSSERPRPTSSERPRPTLPGQPSSERPTPTLPGRLSSEQPRPTPSAGPISTSSEQSPRIDLDQSSEEKKSSVKPSVSIQAHVSIERES